ncbi:MAG TPA: GNAT family N-acetyltransferase [Ideonella sp.]|uniref:GNAT family N-acetyltransferase n=1 Tax=Ideonella sp. TaxID=1929293 RepID=UPI002E303B06|nr:GNAT family N-acetyltransferase [Ideonella sp.]HEX5683427.1 GNAT family N-acetyltransferase [Ideonella sp.]
MHPLDRPVWASLTTTHLPLSEGTSWARRFDRQVNVFAAARDDSTQALAALADLVLPEEQVYLLQVPEIVVPPGLHAVKQAKGVQMVATRRLAGEADLDGIAALGEADAAEMLALAQLTEPGPFLARTHRMGAFVGIREGGRLLGMAGERLRLPGYTEVSGVCTHPHARGRGFARRLSAAVAARIEARGEQPFLHAWSSNHVAIALYESLGFVKRTEVNVALLERPAGV